LKEKIRALLIDDDQGDFVFTKGLLSQITHPTIELDWVPTASADRRMFLTGSN